MLREGAYIFSMYRSFTYLLTLIFVTSFSFGQRLDNTASFRNIAGDNYFRIHYDNDFWGKTDYYYTQGYNLEIVSPILRNNPVTKALVKLPVANIKYGLALEHYGFTPTSIRSNDILVNDRPFAGVIMLKSFSMSTDTVRKQRLTAIVSTGMIGPAAFAGKMQKTIHSWTGDREPLGWQHQIRNDLVLNYELNHEKEIINIPNIISLNTNMNLRAGTLSDRAVAGFTLTLGRFHSPFSTAKNTSLKNFQIYFYNQPMAGLVLYDASLQGGILNRNSLYTLKSSEIKRLTFQNNFGLVVNVGKIYAEYYRTYLSKEFRSGRDHLWGGIKVGIGF